MKNLTIFAIAFTLAASPALAVNPPLAPGRPAGIQNAQLWDNGTGMIVLAGAALIGIGVALATASNGSTPPASATVATTGTSP
jgi:hypothetical protein